MEEKEINSTEKKCSGCGGNLIFSPKTQNLLCENCGKQFEIKESDLPIEKHPLNQTSNQNIGGTNDYYNFTQDNKVFKCPNCGSNVVLNSYEISKNCPYCGTGLVIDEKQIPGLKPDAVIPFMFDESEAGKLFVQNVRKKWFLPNKFKKQLPENKITGVYIPSFAFDCNTKSIYNGELYNEHTTTDRDGHTHTERDYFRVSGNYDNNFLDILVECSSKLTQIQYEGFLPYNCEQKKVYNDAFIRGYSVEHYNQTVEDSKAEYKDIVAKQIRSNILAKYSYSGVSYLNISTNYSNEFYDYYILPVYRFDYDYKKKKYVTYMNGQTGRVDDNVPKSKLKIAMVIILVILLILLPIIIGILTGANK